MMLANDYAGGKHMHTSSMCFHFCDFGTLVAYTTLDNL